MSPEIPGRPPPGPAPSQSLDPDAAVPYAVVGWQILAYTHTAAQQRFEILKNIVFALFSAEKNRKTEPNKSVLTYVQLTHM